MYIYIYIYTDPTAGATATTYYYICTHYCMCPHTTICVLMRMLMFADVCWRMLTYSVLVQMRTQQEAPQQPQQQVLNSLALLVQKYTY
jgi:hypothetical protein